MSSIYKDWCGTPSPAEYAWYPEWIVGTASSAKQAGWSIVGNGNFVAVAGEFIGVNNKALHGIARFTKVPANGPQSGPRLSGATWTPTAKSTRQGSMLVSIPSNQDRDGKKLTYEFRRAGQAQPFATVAASSQYWYLPTVSATDTGVTTGQSYTYQVRAIDSDGNIADSSTVTATATNTTAQPSYAASVVDDGPLVYYRLGNGTTVTDTMGTSNGSGSSMTNTAGAIAGDSNQASTFAGNSLSRAGGSTAFTAPTALSYELWFKTNTTTGGELVGLGNAASGNSSTYDRAVYMSNNGRLNFSSFFGVWRSMATTDSYNDNNWHHLVVSQGLDGTTMYVDGQAKATDSGNRYGRLGFSARLRVGGDVTNQFPNAPSSQWFKGTIDDVSLYPYALTTAQTTAHRTWVWAPRLLPDVQQHRHRHRRTVRRQRLDRLQRRTITSYAWDFGDGTTGPGVSPTHTYAARGQLQGHPDRDRQCRLDGVTTKQVLVHLPPTADFTHTEIGVDASVRRLVVDDDRWATITGYQWNFGDGTTSTPATPTHTYAADGTYDVSLTVTDDLGSILHRDDEAGHGEGARRLRCGHLERTVGAGWGTADVGGAWTGTTGFSVAGGVGHGVGRCHRHSHDRTPGDGRRRPRHVHCRCRQVHRRWHCAGQLLPAQELRGRLPPQAALPEHRCCLGLVGQAGRVHRDPAR